MQANTGTGKTFCFMIPIIESILSARKARGRASRPGEPVQALVISPSRELTNQSLKETKKLITFLQV